jgi:protein-S-isoprenylcysteine O-methyltransferase Ste14
MDTLITPGLANSLLLLGWSGFVLGLIISLVLEQRGPQPARTSGLLLDWVGLAGVLGLYGAMLLGGTRGGLLAPGPGWQPWSAGAGTVLFVAGWGVCGWARWTLGRWWSADVQIKQGQTLRTTGPYGRVRHPMYSGILAAGLGSLLLTGQPAWIAACGASAAYILFKAVLEEQALAAHFGPAWAAYRQRVPALVPRPGRTFRVE